MKRNESIESEHLQEIFKKVRVEDKEKIKEFVDGWFDTYGNEGGEGGDVEVEEERTVCSQVSSSSASTTNNSPLLIPR